MAVIVDTSGVKKYVERLQKMHRSDFPVVARQTLTGLAYDMKTRTLPISGKDTFVTRQANFIKANSTFIKAEGFDVGKMTARVGFTDARLKEGSSRQSITDLQQQEEGGSIGHRGFISMDTARVGTQNRKSVRPNARLSAIKKISPAYLSPEKTAKSKFVETVLFAGVGGIVLGNAPGNQILWRVDSINIVKERGYWHPVFKLTPLYTYVPGRSVRVKATHFSLRAANITGKQVEKIFIKNAEARFTKALSK